MMDDAMRALVVADMSTMPAMEQSAARQPAAMADSATNESRTVSGN
jgi:hypothetical protein